MASVFDDGWYVLEFLFVQYCVHASNFTVIHKLECDVLDACEVCVHVTYVLNNGHENKRMIDCLFLYTMIGHQRFHLISISIIHHILFVILPKG